MSDPVTDAATAAQAQAQSRPMDERTKGIDLSQILSSVLGNMGQGTVPLTTNSSSGGTFIPPVQKQAAPFTTQAPREYRSRGGANQAAASNLFGNIASAVNTAKQNSDMQKSRKLAIDVERVYTAQAGIEQAKETLKQNPNDPNAKQMMEKNTQIINDMLSDPKKRKELEEAFNYSFIGDDKKANSWQRKAGDMGAKTYQQQLEKQMPQTQQINPVAVQQQKAASEQMKAMSPIISAVIRAAGEQNKTQSQAEIAQQKIQQQGEDSWLKYQASEDRTRMLGQAEKQRYMLMFQRNSIMAQSLTAKIGNDGIKNTLTAIKSQSDFLNNQIKNTTFRINQLTRSGKIDDAKSPEAQEMKMLRGQLDQMNLKALDMQAKQDAISNIVGGGKPQGALTNTTVGGKDGKPISSNSNGNSAAGAISASATADESDDDLINSTDASDEELNN